MNHHQVALPTVFQKIHRYWRPEISQRPPFHWDDVGPPFMTVPKKGIAKMALGLPPKKKFKAKNTKLKPGAQIHATVPWYTMKRAPGISCSGSACGHDFGMGICHPNFSKSSVGSNQS